MKIHISYTLTSLSDPHSELNVETLEQTQLDSNPF